MGVEQEEEDNIFIANAMLDSSHHPVVSHIFPLGVRAFG